MLLKLNPYIVEMERALNPYIIEMERVRDHLVLSSYITHEKTEPKKREVTWPQSVLTFRLWNETDLC